MKINDRIIRLMINTKRYNFEFTHLLIGEKEMEKQLNAMMEIK